MASDASPEEPRGNTGPKFIAPLPPRKPADLGTFALAGAPMPPVRPAELILASAKDQSGGAFQPPSNKGFGPAPQRGSLPQVITSGVDRAPTGALALAEGLSLPTTSDDSELLARAAALTAPLPPMPIANVGAPAAAPDQTATLDQTAAPPAHGWVVRTAALAAEDLAQLFERLPFGGSKTAAPALRALANWTARSNRLTLPTLL